MDTDRRTPTPAELAAFSAAFERHNRDMSICLLLILDIGGPYFSHDIPKFLAPRVINRDRRGDKLVKHGNVTVQVLLFLSASVPFLFQA